MVDRDSNHQRGVDGALGRVGLARSAVSRADNVLRREVCQARALGATWAEIGRVVGMSGQGAQKRFGNCEEVEQVSELESLQRSNKRLLKNARTCPVCGEEFTRADAMRRHAREAHNSDAPGPGDPWPDGTTQGTIAP